MKWRGRLRILLNKAPGVHPERTDATFDFEEGDGLVKYLGRKVCGSHNVIAFSEAFGDGF